MKVLFTHSYFYRLDPKQWRLKQPYPPLGTLIAAAVAREDNHEVDLFDSNLQVGPEAILPALQKKPDVLVIYDDGFNYLTKMCLLVMRQAAFKMMEWARAEGSKVIVTGSDASDRFEKYLDHGADYVIRGEGEGALRELLLALERGESPDPLEGVIHRKDGRTVTNPPRRVMRDLDLFPLPAWDLVDMNSYRSVWKKHHGYFSLNIATTRGCPYKCNWCAKPIYGNRYSVRSPDQVVKEIRMLQETYRTDHFWICDDIFGLKPGWVQSFSEKLKEQNLIIRFKMQSRADLLLSPGVVDALAASGAESIWIGAESGSQKILDAMDKGTTVGQIRESSGLLKKSGIRVGYFLQFGYPGESRKEIDETVRLVMETMPDEIGISVSYPLPGTKFFEAVKSSLQSKQNWSDSDDLAMMFQSPHPAPYYRILHRYVHSRYRIERGIRKLKSWQFHHLRSIASMIYHTVASWTQMRKLRQLSHDIG